MRVGCLRGRSAGKVVNELYCRHVVDIRSIELGTILSQKQYDLA